MNYRQCNCKVKEYIFCTKSLKLKYVNKLNFLVPIHIQFCGEEESVEVTVLL